MEPFFDLILTSTRHMEAVGLGDSCEKKYPDFAQEPISSVDEETKKGSLPILASMSTVPQVRRPSTTLGFGYATVDRGSIFPETETD